MAYVIVGMSGGVDSSVSAHLLIQEGHKVEGLFMKNWEEEDGSCTASEDIEDAQKACDTLGIPLHKINFAAEYWDNVFSYFLSEYESGRTPNPDILCNSEIKFKYFVDYAKSLGADYIATGHYAGILKTSDGDLNLVKGKDQSKDQSYFLYNLNQEQLASAMFPLAGLEKTKIREIAKEINLLNHNKKDSTGVCFISPGKFRTFLQTYIPSKPGKILTVDGKHVGDHEGVMYYTIGQRQGLGIGGHKDYPDEPWFVVEKNVSDNTLTVVQGTNNELLYHDALISGPIHWINPTNNAGATFKCKAKIRYRQPDQACTVKISDNECKIIFEEKQRAISPGQSVVFYDNETCLGGAIIQKALNIN